MTLNPTDHPVGSRLLLSRHSVMFEATVVEWSPRQHVKLRGDDGRERWEPTFAGWGEISVVDVLPLTGDR